MSEKKAYDNRNSFRLFLNTKKINPKAPDYEGDYTDASNKVWKTAAWQKTDRNGNIWYSGKIEEMKEYKPKVTDEIDF